ncbi:hypothetical protein [Microbacterium sp. MTN4-26]|uniref:hypothetical protein n=1 Tax=unclassified Microbacterium TaxID=2609290 RepID=UPI0036F23E83
MARKYEIAIASETGAFEKGIKSGVIEPLEDAEKALEDLGDANVGRDIDRDLKIAERATKDLKDETKDTAEAIERHFRQSYKKVQDDSRQTTNRMKEGFDEAADEAGQSGREAAASFSGEFDDVADFVQETLANALSGFGPIGAAAGIALATIMGTVLSQAALAQERLAEARERAVDLASVMYENGGELPMSERVDDLIELLGSERLARNPIEALANDFIDLGTNIDQVKDAARAAETPVEKLISGLSGANLRDTQDALDAVNDALEKMKEESSDVNLDDWAKRKDTLTAMRGELEKTVEQSELANELYNSTKFLNSERIEALAESWQNAAVDAENYFTVTEEGASEFDLEKYLRDSEAVEKANAYVRDNLELLPPEVAAEAARVAEEAGPQAAQGYIESYLGADAANRGRIIDAARRNGTAAGKTQGSAMNDAVQNALRRNFEVPVRLRLNTSEYDNWTPARKTAYVNMRINQPGYQQFV